MTELTDDDLRMIGKDMIGKTVRYNGWKLGVITAVRQAPFLHPGPVFVLDNNHSLRDFRDQHPWTTDGDAQHDNHDN